MNKFFVNYILEKARREDEKFYREEERKRAVWIIIPRYSREKILICLLGVQPCFVERYFRFSLLLQVPEYFGVSRRKKKKTKKLLSALGLGFYRALDEHD